MTSVAGDALLQGISVGVPPPAPTDSFLPTVLVAIMGPYPMDVDGQTTLDYTLAACAKIDATPVFIPDLITDEEKVSTEKSVRLRGMTAMRNEGIRMAEEGGYDYLLLIENDVKMKPETIYRLLHHGEDICIPRLTFPHCEPVEWMVYGPREKPLQGGMLELTWAAHCIILFKVDALKRLTHPIFDGESSAEGKDHMAWQHQGVHAQMDLDTPIEVLELANGHKSFYEIPFQSHLRNAVACDGPVFMYAEGRNVRVYRCRVEECEYEMTQIMQKAIDESTSHSYEWTAQLSLERDYWADRAPFYNNLDWTRDQGYLQSIMDMGDVQSNDLVLDTGTGPGAIARLAAITAKEVIGMDLSPDMLGESTQFNLEFAIGDIRAIPYPRFFFNKVFARMVLHGLVREDDAEHAVRECHRVLMDGGKFIVSEGVPTSNAIRSWYTKTFQHKEERLTFSETHIKKLLRTVGFTKIKAETHTIRQSSVRNWLENSALTDEKSRHIMDRYQAMPVHVQQGYNATFTEDDVLIDLKFVNIAGLK